MSTLKVNAIQGVDGVERYLARAWVNFNGTGTVAIRAAGNVSSITDNGTGDYTVNFTNALADANYAAAGMCYPDGAGQVQHVRFGTGTLSASGLRVVTSAGAAGSETTYDSSLVSVAVFR